MERLVQQLQRTLIRIYDLDLPLDAAKFLLEGDLLDRGRHTIAPSQSGMGQLYVMEVGDEVYLAVYLNPSVVENLESNDPLVEINTGNLADYLTVAEEVSHFVYVAWRAQYERPLTSLELELQGEIDKFFSVLFGLQHQDKGPVPWASLWETLFRHYRLRDALDEEEFERYEKASRLAGVYCGQLVNRFMDSSDRLSWAPPLMNELRRFYRLGQEEKIRRIERLC